MQVSFDGVRERLAVGYNEVVEEIRTVKFKSGTDTEQLAMKLEMLRMSIGSLLAMYDEDVDDDCNVVNIDLLECRIAKDPSKRVPPVKEAENAAGS